MASTGTRPRRRRPTCPFCGYDDQVVAVVYGLPAAEMIEQSRRGEVALGGSFVGPDAHRWYCKGCLQSFNMPGAYEDQAGK